LYVAVVQKIRAQLEGMPYHSPKLHLGPCNSVGMRRGHTQTLVTNIHFATPTPHAKCNNNKLHATVVSYVVGLGYLLLAYNQPI